MFIAGHGHTVQNNKNFVEWLKRHDSHFLVSFAYPDMGRLRFARKVRREQKKGKK